MWTLLFLFSKDSRQMEGLQRAENPTQSIQKFLRRGADGGRGWRYAAFGRSLRRQRHIGSSCDYLELRAPCHARLLARSGAAADGLLWKYGVERQQLDALSQPQQPAPFCPSTGPCATLSLSMLTYCRTSRSLHFPFGAVCSLSGALGTGDLVCQLEATTGPPVHRIAFPLFVATGSALEPFNPRPSSSAPPEGEGAPGSSGPVHSGPYGPRQAATPTSKRYMRGRA